MEIINEYTRHIRPFESLMHNKGYLDKFEMTVENSTRFHHRGILKHCLEAFLSGMLKESITVSDFSLKTFAEYLSANDYKECHFSGSFDTIKGFTIERMLVQSRFPDETQRLSLRNNHEVPGKNAVIGRFRKPKSWERLMRGDFKYKRRY